MKKTGLIIGVMILVILVLLVILSWGMPENDNMESMNGNAVNNGGNPSVSENVIQITDNGFLPKDLTINVGETVTFVNNVDRKSWPATDIHPTHTVYPGSNIDKCGTTEESAVFDSCKGLEKGESYSFTFNQAGNWKYHDHLRARFGGTITIQ